MFKAQNFKYFKIVLFLLLFFSSFFSIYSFAGAGAASSTPIETRDSSSNVFENLFMDPKDLNFSCSGDANLNSREQASEFKDLLSLIKQIFLSLCFLINFFGSNPVFFVILFSFIVSILITIMLKTSEFSGNAGKNIKKIAPILGLIIFIFLCIALIPAAETFIENIPTMVVLILSITLATIVSPMLTPKSQEQNNYMLVFIFIFVFYFANCVVTFFISNQFSFVFPFVGDGITSIFELHKIILLIFVIILFLTALKLVSRSKGKFEEGAGIADDNDSNSNSSNSSSGNSQSGSSRSRRGRDRALKSLRESRRENRNLEKKNELRNSLVNVLGRVGTETQKIHNTIQNSRSLNTPEIKTSLESSIDSIRTIIGTFNEQVQRFDSGISQREYSIFRSQWDSFRGSLNNLEHLGPSIQECNNSTVKYLSSVSQNLSLGISEEVIRNSLYTPLTQRRIEELQREMERQRLAEDERERAREQENIRNATISRTRNLIDNNIQDLQQEFINQINELNNTRGGER